MFSLKCLWCSRLRRCFFPISNQFFTFISFVDRFRGVYDNPKNEKQDLICSIGRIDESILSIQLIANDFNDFDIVWFNLNLLWSFAILLFLL